MDENILRKFQKETVILMSVQHLGNAELPDIHKYTQGIENVDGKPFKMREGTIKQLCESLRSRGFLSIGYTQKKDGSIPFYKMQKGYVKFPEVAQIKDVVKDDSVQALINELEGRKGSKKTRIDRKYYRALIEWEVIDGVAGGQPSTSGMHLHIRDSKGNIIFPPSHFKNYIREVIKLANHSAYVVDDISFDYGKAHLNGHKMDTHEYHPGVRGDVRGKSGGASKVIKELLPPGAQITVEAMIPGNVLPPEDFKKLLTIGGRFSPRGFGSYSKRWGKLKLMRFEVLEKLDFGAK